MKVSSWHRITGNPDFKPKSCFSPMVVYHRDKKLLPLSRFLNPYAFVRNPGVISDLIREAFHINRLDNMPYNENLLTLCIEEFRDPRTIDLVDACHCNKVYMTELGYSRSCIYNVMLRRPGPEASGKRVVC